MKREANKRPGNVPGLEDDGVTITLLAFASHEQQPACRAVAP